MWLSASKGSATVEPAVRQFLSSCQYYETDDRGILTMINLIVATQNNAAPICLSVKKAAQGLIRGPDVSEGMLNRVEMAFRAYDPGLSCATHALPWKSPLTVNMRDKEGKVIRTINRP